MRDAGAVSRILEHNDVSLLAGGDQRLQGREQTVISRISIQKKLCLKSKRAQGSSPKLGIGNTSIELVHSRVSVDSNTDCSPLAPSRQSNIRSSWLEHRG